MVIPTEEYQRSLARNAINELLQSDCQRCFLPTTPIHQAAPNLHTKIYKLSAPEGELFIKHYYDRLDIAATEYDNYQFFKGLPFVPKLLCRALDMDKKSAIIAYEYIPGCDLHEEFTRRKKQGEYIPVSLGTQAIDQFYEMGAALRNSRFETTVVPWALRSPVREGFLNPSEEIAFLADYQVVFDRNRETLKFFPGFYFDRNPRNIMYSRGHIMEVDYNVIEFSSPLFDLAKFLRNGVDIPFLNSINPSLLNVYSDQEENQILEYVYNRQLEVSPLSANSFGNFRLMFSYAAIHAHIFYLTKYAKMLKEGKGDINKLFPRCFYHFGVLNKTIEELRLTGEPVDRLKVWVERFISLRKFE